MEDLVYLNSFLDKKSEIYMPLDTYSYSIVEYALKKYNADAGLVTRNPNIDTSFNVKGNNKLYLSIRKSQAESQNNIQVLTFASPLFEDKLKQYSMKLVANMIYIKLVNPSATHEVIRNDDIGL